MTVMCLNAAFEIVYDVFNVDKHFQRLPIEPFLIMFLAMFSKPSQSELVNFNKLL